MQKDKYGEITIENLQMALDNIAEGETTVKEIRRKTIVEFNNSKRMYNVDTEGNVTSYTYVDLGIMEDGYVFYQQIADYRNAILNVKVVDYLEIPTGAVSFDVSEKQNGSIKAWFVVNSENSEYYDLYIGGIEGVQAPVSCYGLFTGMVNCLSIDLEYLYTENTESFTFMFGNCNNLTTIKNLEYLDTSNVTTMQGMFGYCNKMQEIKVDNFDTKNVTNMYQMFINCSGLKSINVLNWDTSNVKRMDELFIGCSSLEILNLSNFDTNKVTTMRNMFRNTYNLNTIYVGNKWDNSNVTNSDNMFLSCYKLKGAIEYDSTKIDVNYANWENGYFTLLEN